MSNVIILSNTNFNLSKGLSTKEWLKNQEEYFNNEFIPYLQENHRDNDILVHLGNLTTKSKSIDLSVLTFIQDTFEKIASILPVYIIAGENDSQSLNILKNFKNIEIIRKPTQVEILLSQKFTMLPFGSLVSDIWAFEDSDYCFFNFDYLNSPSKDIIISRMKKFKICYCGFYEKNTAIANIRNISGPYNIDDDAKKGFALLETFENKDKMIWNKTSKKFKKIEINTEEELNIDKELLEKNYISVILNKTLFNDSKMKVNAFLDKTSLYSLTFSDDEILKDKEDIINLNQNSLSLNEMVVDFIEKSEIPHKEEVLKAFVKIKNLKLKT